MAIHPLSLMSAPPAGPLPDYPRPPLCVTLSPRTARLCDWLWDIHVTLWVPTLWRQVCVYDIVKVCRKGEAGGGLLWLAYILAARNNSFIFLFLCPRISERRRTQHHICVYTTPIFQHHILKTSQAMRKQLDPRIPALINNGVKANHRSFFVMVGDKGRDQVCPGMQAAMRFD